MTIDELFRVCELAIHDGRGKARVLFDTEAAAYNCHAVEVTGGYVEDIPGDGTDWALILTHHTPVVRCWIDTTLPPKQGAHDA